MAADEEADELLAWAGVSDDYASLGEQQRVQLLAGELRLRRPLVRHRDALRITAVVLAAVAALLTASWTGLLVVGVALAVVEIGLTTLTPAPGAGRDAALAPPPPVDATPRVFDRSP